MIVSCEMRQLSKTQHLLQEEVGRLGIGRNGTRVASSSSSSSSSFAGAANVATHHQNIQYGFFARPHAVLNNETVILSIKSSPRTSAYLDQSGSSRYYRSLLTHIFVGAQPTDFVFILFLIDLSLQLLSPFIQGLFFLPILSRRNCCRFGFSIWVFFDIHAIACCLYKIGSNSRAHPVTFNQVLNQNTGIFILFSSSCTHNHEGEEEGPLLYPFEGVSWLRREISV